MSSTLYLEKYIHDKIRGEFVLDPDYRGFSGLSKISELGRDQVERYQLYRFRAIFDYVLENSPFYQERYARSRKPESLREISSLPFTYAEDLRQSPYDMLCIPMSDIARTFSHTTTGTTTGEPKRIFFAYHDADKIVNSMEAIMRTVLNGDKKKHEVRVSIYLPDNGGAVSIAGLIARAVERLGGVPFIGDCFSSTEMQIDAIKQTEPEMIMGSAFRIWRITQEAREWHDLKAIGINKIFITSEYLSVPMRHYLEDWWNAEVYHHYGMSEPGFAIGVECDQHDGFHFNESDLYFEVIDPYSGQVINGEDEGELVLTTLDREAMPLIRYRTGDIARILRTPCNCGASTLIRIGKLPRRLALAVALKGSGVIYSSLFDEALHQLPELVDYRIIIDEEGGFDLLECVAEILGGENQNTHTRLFHQLLTVPAVKIGYESGLLRIKISYSKRGDLRRGGTSQKRRIMDGRSNKEKVIE